MRRFSNNRLLLIITAVMLLVGLIMLMDASSVAAQQKTNNVFFYIAHQLLMGVLPGLGLLLFFNWFDYHRFKKISFWLLVINLILLLLVFIPQLSIKEVRAMRWIQLGSVSFQPSEFLKITLILFLAAWLADKDKKEITSFRKTTLPVILIIGIISLPIIKQPATSILIILAMAVWFMMLIAGVKPFHLFILVLIGAAALFAITHFSSYRLNRLKCFLSPVTNDQNILNECYQLNQSLIGIGSGGLLGVGFGKSVQKYNYLPETYTDSIFAIISEEFGFLGILVIIGLYLLFLLAVFRIARSASDNFGCYLAVGLGAWIISQAFVNISVSGGLIPVMGLPLPFFSYGGTSLIVTLASVGILLNIGRYHKYS